MLLRQADQAGIGQRYRHVSVSLDQLPHVADLVVEAKPRGDLFGLTSDEVRNRFPAVFQWVVERVKPDRDQNNRPTYRDNWWIFGEPR